MEGEFALAFRQIPRTHDYWDYVYRLSYRRPGKCGEDQFIFCSYGCAQNHQHITI